MYNTVPSLSILKICLEFTENKKICQNSGKILTLLVGISSTYRRVKTSNDIAGSRVWLFEVTLWDLRKE
jgi:hypothetical protein